MAANPRAAAVAALVRQEQNGFSNLVLDAELKRQKLEGRDKAFASAIFYTVLEHRGTLDYILEQFLPKGLAKLDAPVREILRAALAQARYMQVPVSAAVNEAVKLTRTFKKSSASGLVNAVLRKACGYDLDAAVFTDEIQRLMVLGSAGRDVAKFLHKNYPDEALGILTYQADGGLTSLRANPLKASAAQLCALLTEQGAAEVRQGIVPGSVLARFAGSPADNELFRQGYYHVEGQASQLAALCVGAAPGETVLDLCAAPGGKTILLAEQMQGTGELYSCDAAENRVGLIRTAVDRMGFTGVHTLCNDATKPNQRQQLPRQFTVVQGRFIHQAKEPVCQLYIPQKDDTFCGHEGLPARKQPLLTGQYRFCRPRTIGSHIPFHTLLLGRNQVQLLTRNTIKIYEN